MMRAPVAALLPPWWRIGAIFAAFAFAYFLAALLRAVTATLAPAFSSELGLDAADLGLLAGAYFFGFAAMQLPLGAALDRFGPRSVVMCLLVLAVVGCVGFSTFHSLAGLVLARACIGVGVSACLMAPLTCFRRLLSTSAQLRANSWMLMTGSLGMVGSTVPVQWLLPQWGWRALFVALSLMLACAIAMIWLAVPPDRPASPGASGPVSAFGYREIVRHPLFRRLAPVAFFNYGGLIAVQALWAGPWLTRVSGWSPADAAVGLLCINVSMLISFLCWGLLMPTLARRGLGVSRLMALGLPASLVMLVVIVGLGSRSSAWHWAIWCVASTFVSLSQPAVGQAFPPRLAGRALSAFNLVIFSGVFVLQWGLGMLIDLVAGHGWTVERAFQLSFGLFAIGCWLAYGWFLFSPRAHADNQVLPSTP